jgi:hypothetical protein
MEQSTVLDTGLVEAQEALEPHHAFHEIRGLGDPVVFLLAFTFLLLFALQIFYLTFRETAPWQVCECVCSWNPLLL